MRFKTWISVVYCPLFCRFGTHVSGAPPIKRSLRINNTSPFGKLCAFHCIESSLCAEFVSYFLMILCMPVGLIFFATLSPLFLMWDFTDVICAVTGGWYQSISGTKTLGWYHIFGAVTAVLSSRGFGTANYWHAITKVFQRSFLLVSTTCLWSFIHGFTGLNNRKRGTTSWQWHG